MTLEQLKLQFINELATTYPKLEIISFFKLLIDHRLNLSSIDLILKKELEIKPEQLIYFMEDIAKLKQEIPIQYIIGEGFFYDLNFTLNKHVLIPRPETEELVAWILSDIYSKNSNADQKEIAILDIGTGSGCIAISLAKNLPHAKVFALDNSAEALKIAKINAINNKVKIHLVQADILKITKNMQATLSKNKFDIIVSNPPYIREIEKAKIAKNVLGYEPHQALFVPDTKPLLFYEAILNFATDHLNNKGFCYFEINEALGLAAKSLIAQYKSSHIELRQDLFLKDRMIKVSF